MVTGGSSFDPNEFHELAISLVQADCTEKALRTAINREYYACHHVAMSRLTSTGFSPAGGAADHGGVIRELRRRNRDFLGNCLDELREMREHVDYHLGATPDNTNQGCDICRDVCQAAPCPVRPAVQWRHWEKVNQIAQRILPNLANF